MFVPGLRSPNPLVTRSAGIAALSIVGAMLRPERAGHDDDGVERRDVADLRADLYAPAGGPWPAVVIVLGAVREGRRYPILGHMARSIARCGFAVLVPELGRLRELVLDESALGEVVSASTSLPSLRGVAGGPAALIGFSLGGSLALVAAADPRLRGRVACVASMGGYFRLTDMVAAAIRGELVPPSTYAVVVSLAAALPGADRDRIRAALERDPDRPLDAVAALDENAAGAGGRLLITSVRGRDAGRLPALLAALPGAEAMMARLSPEAALRDVSVPVWALHDERDRYVPVGQLELMRAAAAGRPGFTFARTRLLEHTEPVPFALNPVVLVRDYAPGLVELFRFARGPLGAVRTASRRPRP